MAGATKCVLGGEGGPEGSSFNELGIDLCCWRADEKLFIRQQKALSKYFRNSPGPVVDLGCGWGTMLGILNSEGIINYGIDGFPSAVEVCRKRGLTATESDIFSHLATLGDSSLGGIFCSHVIEHLHPPQALRLIRESYRVLKSGGTLVLVTPNPQNLLVLTEVFWLDLTHVRFYPLRLLNRVLEEVGFSFVKCFEDKHTRYGTPYRAIAGFLRRIWFWGLANRGDVVAVGRK